MRIKYGVNAFDYVHDGIKGLLVDNTVFVNLTPKPYYVQNAFIPKTYEELDVPIGTVFYGGENPNVISDLYLNYDYIDNSCIESNLESSVNFILNSDVEWRLRSIWVDYVNNIKDYNIIPHIVDLNIYYSPYPVYIVVEGKRPYTVYDPHNPLSDISGHYQAGYTYHFVSYFYGFNYEIIKKCCELNFKPIIKILGG